MIKGIIFDMDGLMIDSERITFECFQEVLKDYNLTMTKDFYIKLLGKTVDSCYELFNNTYGDIDAPKIFKDCHILLDYRFEVEGIPLKDGLIELLDFLKSNNYKTIVATSSYRNRVNKILLRANINNFFDDSICGDEVINGKPNPEVFLKALDKLNLKADEVLILEDSEAGIQAAFNAGIKVICVPDMKYPEKKFQEKTYKILDNLKKVKEIL